MGRGSQNIKLYKIKDNPAIESRHLICDADPKCKETELKKGKRRLEYKNHNGDFYNPNGPVRVVLRADGSVKESWFVSKAEQSKANTIVVKKWYKNKQLKSEAYFVNRKLHRINGPAYRKWDRDGKLTEESFYRNGILFLNN